MNNTKSTNKKTTPTLTKAQAFLEEWKRRKKEDEEWFAEERKSPEYRRMMEELSGKIVKNGKIISAT